MKKSSNSTSIKVFCRLRPLNRLEKEQGGECCVQYTDKAIKVKVAGVDNPYDFGFDGIFGPDSAQIDVFNTVAKPVIDGLMDGYNGTLFAYGQTSSGKTFTMEGPDVVDSDEKLGIIPRMMNYLFNWMMNSSEDIEFNVKVSFLELYNEKLQDLLDARKNNLQIKEDKQKGIFVQDMTEVYVSSPEQMKQVHKSGFENRTIAATRMNERSSRSHSIFVLHVDQKDTKTDTTKHSKLYFVDLAGSEKIAKTNVTGQQLEEAKNINKSLTALGMVINALTEKDKSHVPYRDSKLTRLLQESLGGNSQTSLILACSMCTYNDKETVDTLRFGARAKNIKNAPIVNAERSAKELTILLTAAEKKIHDQEELIQGLQIQISGGIAPIKRPIASQQAEVAVEETQSPTEDKVSVAPKESKTGGNNAPSSLMLVKHQLEITNLKEELEEMKANYKELEAELSAKNKENYDLNGKILQYESQLNEFNSKNTVALEEVQMQFEKVYHENQEKTMLANKFKRAIKRLKADLNFVNISKHLKTLEGGDSNLGVITGGSEKELGSKDELVYGSIQKTIDMLEEIEREIEDSEQKATMSGTTPNEEMENLIDELMKSSPSNSMMSKEQGNLLANGTEDDIRGIPWMMECSSSENNKDKDSVDLENSKIEGETEDDTQKSQIQFQSFMEDGKVAELQTLITNQRKTINNLTKLNSELSQTNHKFQVAQEKNLNIYKTKLEEFQKANSEKIKEYDNKVHSLKMLLEGKIHEIESTKSSYEKYLLEKAETVNDLRAQNQKLQGLIAGDVAATKSYDLDNTLREVTRERKQLSEEITRLRKEADEQDEVIKKKQEQIEMLQANLGLAAKEIKTLKQNRVMNVDFLNGRSQKDGKEGGKSKNKAEFSIFDKHVVKPIRGGGGDAGNFERNNLFTLDKGMKNEGNEEKKVRRDNEGKTAGKTGFFVGGVEDSKGGKMKKFEEMYKDQHKRPSSVNKARQIGGGVDIGMDDEEGKKTLPDTQQKIVDFTAKSLANGQKNIKAFLGNVKSLFS